MLKFIVLLAAVSCMHGARIAGGESTTISQYPFLAQVEFKSVLLWSQTCAASILNERFLVSAAHCFSGRLFTISDRRIRVGSTRRNNFGTVHQLIWRVNHPNFKDGLDGDITVIQTATAIVMGTNVQPTPVISQGFDVPDDAPVVVAGWGAKYAGGSLSSKLRDVVVNTVNQTVCFERYLNVPGSSITNNMICTSTNGRGSCEGDEGGPVYYGGVLIGVVSSVGCLKPDLPSVSTRVASYTNWIVINARFTQ